MQEEMKRLENVAREVKLQTASKHQKESLKSTEVVKNFNFA